MMIVIFISSIQEYGLNIVHLFGIRNAVQNAACCYVGGYGFRYRGPEVATTKDR